MAKNISFEENLEKLRKIVEELEGGESSLDDSIGKFQDGINIIKQCHKELEEAELKVDTIIKKDGKIIAVPTKSK